MKVSLLENQIDIILKSLENYTRINPDKIQLIYSTYESLMAQKASNINSFQCNENVILNFQKTIYK